MGVKLKYQEVKEFIESKSNCKLLSNEYKNCDTKMIFKCGCGNTFETTFAKFKSRNKRQCNECGNKKTAQNLKLSYKDVKKFIETNSNCELLSREYVNAHTKMMFKCICGNNFETTYSIFKYGNKRQCNKCTKEYVYDKYAKNNEEFTKEVYSLVGDEYIFLEHYINAQTKIKCKHNTKECGYEWDVKPTHFLYSESKCPKCMIRISSEKRIKTTEEYKNDVFNRTQDEYTVIGEYINAKTKIKMRHNLCSNEYFVTPNQFLNGCRCPQCNESKGEEEIRLQLEYSNIKYIPQHTFNDCRNKRPLPFDFYLPEYNLLIEYDGIQHFELTNFGGISDEDAEANFKQIQYHDNIKNDYCHEQNIKLLRIPYWDFDNIGKILNDELLK